MNEFPEEIMNAMLRKQEEQGNRKDKTIFDAKPLAGKSNGGFDWKDTSEGSDFWENIIVLKKFNLFFEKYPRNKIMHYMTGKLNSFPEEIVIKMLENQKEQIGQSDINVFVKEPASGKRSGGFDWFMFDSNFWDNVISKRNFKYFFNEYYITSNMKFQTGDRVKVKSPEWYNRNKNLNGIVYSGHYLFTNEMEKYAGETAIIEYSGNNGYRLNIDNNEFGWTDDMLEFDYKTKMQKAKIIWAHPAIGKTTYLEKNQDIIEWDQEVNAKRDEFIREQIDPKHSLNTCLKEYKKLRSYYMTNWKSNQKYVEFLTKEWTNLKSRALKEGKRLFASPTPLLEMFTDDFDVVINIPDNVFIEREVQRGGAKDISIKWKRSINSIINVIQESKKIITTSEFFSDFMSDVFGGIDEKELVGELSGVPVHVIQRILLKQRQQLGKSNIKVFQKDICADESVGGFTWANTFEGFDYWRRVLRCKEFDLAFDSDYKIKNRRKVGDKVIIIPELFNKKRGRHDNFLLVGNAYVTEPMVKYMGREATIVNCNYNGYNLDIDGGRYTWTDDMLEDCNSHNEASNYNTQKQASEKTFPRNVLVKGLMGVYVRSVALCKMNNGILVITNYDVEKLNNLYSKDPSLSMAVTYFEEFEEIDKFTYTKKEIAEKLKVPVELLIIK